MMAAAALPLQVLIETHGALREVQRIAAHPRVGHCPWSDGLRLRAPRCHPGLGHERARAVRAPAGGARQAGDRGPPHAYGKVPSHCVVTEFRTARPAGPAAGAGGPAVWLHADVEHPPDQIQPILTPSRRCRRRSDEAIEIIHAAQSADWAPIQHRQRLHDRASYRYYWRVIERAHRTLASRCRGRARALVCRTRASGEAPRRRPRAAGQSQTDKFAYGVGGPDERTWMNAPRTLRFLRLAQG